MIRTHQSHNNGQTNATSGRPVTALEESHANISFEHFLTASTLKTILGTYRNICEYLHLKPNVIPQFYPKLKAHVNSWKAKPLWKKFDYRANQKCYGRGRACPNTRVLIIGAGPCGLRSAIEAQLLGAKVVVVEKRDRMSRNNVLHLWPFVIEDLRMLGAKKFFGKFCAGAIDHISIRQLQCILMKVALLLGVEIHTEVSFERLIEPNLEDKIGWRAEFKPADHPVSQFEFDVVLGADGKRNTLHGFKRKEFRGKLAIAITANFINKRTEAEARVEEISGVAFIFNQKFFKDLYADTGIDLENIVYYKDDTHYFVMTAKKQSLIEKSVIKKDVPDTARLLAPDNVDREELMNYAREAAEFSTNYQMPDLEFAVNHYGQPDVAMFDFTSMYAAENASRVIERHGYKLLSILVGDSLLEPFWPTGSGCARGFLSSMDAAWAIRSWGSGHTTPLEVLSERESIYRLLAQTTPENLNKDYKSYMLDPSTRYPNLNRNVLSPHQVTGLYDTDDPKAIELKPRLPPSVIEVPKKRRRRESHVDPDTLLSWIKSQVREHGDLEVTDITSSFKDGQVLCAILHHYRPDLLDYSAIPTNDAAKNNQLAFDLLEQELGIPPVMTAQEIEASEVPDYLKMLSYLTQIYDTFRCEIPHIKHPKLIEDNELRPSKNSPLTRDANGRSLNLKPSLVTPNSSAIISEDGAKYKCDMLSSSGSHSSSRYTELEDIPTKEAKSADTRTDLILIPIKSIENYLSKNDVPKEAADGNSFDGNRLDARDVSSSELMMDETLNLNARRICGESKSDPLFVKIKKTKSKVSVKCKKPIHLKRNPVSANLKLTNVQKRCNVKSVKTDYISKPIFKYCDDNFNEISPEKATDHARKVFLRDSETSMKNSSKLVKNNTSTQTSNESIKKILNEITTNSSSEFNDLMSCKQSSNDSFSTIRGIISTKSSKTNDDLKRKSSNEVTTKNDSSMQGSQEITRDFLNEMDLFLHYQDFASQKLNEFRNKPKKIRENNFKINIKCTKNNKDENIQLYPSEIPSFLLKNKKNESPDIFIKNVEHKDRDTVTVQEMKFFSLANVLRIVPRIISNVFTRRNPVTFDKTKSEGICQRKFYKSLDGNKFLSDATMSDSKIVASNALLSRVEGWINSSNFDDPIIMSPGHKERIFETNLNDNDTDITSVTKHFDALDNMEVTLNSKVHKAQVVQGEQSRHKSSTVHSYESTESMSKFVETVKTNQILKGVAKLTNISAWELYEGRTKPKSDAGELFSTIVEGEESDLPDSKRCETVVKLPTGLGHEKLDATGLSTRPLSRHKRHIDVNSVPKPIVTTQDRKTRKRKTLEKVGASVEERQKRLEDIASNRFDRQNKRRQQRKNQTEQFIKSMQMLQANCKPDHSEPFEDYSIFLYRQTAPNFEDRVKDLEKMFTYVPDRENRLLTQTRRETDEDFAARIKDLEDKWRDPVPVEKKPKDLLRAIGKIETSDWNIKEIEKKIIENKVGKAVNKDKEKVPKWSREQFLARQNKMERQHLERQESSEMKFAEIDKNIKQLEQRLKEGSTRDLNQQKVATITEKFGKPIELPPQQPKPLEKSNSRAMVLPSQGSEHCHFCSKRVYLMERLSAEGKFFHRGCFRCQYCHTLLRLGSYMFDREGLHGKRFYCTQHYGMPGELRANKVDKKDLQEQPMEIPEAKLLTSVIGVDLLDRVQTPERIEFSNLSTGHISSDHEESPSPIDEDEWTDRNFKNSVIDSDSPDDSSSSSDSNSDDDEAFEEALEEPATKEGTLKWAERYKKRYSRKHYDDIYSDEYSSSDDSSYCENSSGDEESDTATEGEEEIRARELRKQEVRVEPPVTDTGTDTEIASDESCSESSSEIQNSATEISTDSEFAHDDPTPTREAPKKIFDDYVTKTRGSSGQPKRVQVKSGILQQPMNGRTQNKNIELKFTPLVPTPVVKKPAPTSLFVRNEGYPLNRTQSTGGIATKVSLELKKKYLLGETNMSGSIQKSGSASTLDSKFKLFHTNISDCQKLLKPASEISTSMQVFCSKLNERTSPLSPTFASPSIKERTSSGLELNLSSIEFSKDSAKDAIPKLDIAKCASESSIPELTEVKIVNETEGRPRSPVHERSIVVPTINWEKAKQLKDKVFTDSLSSSDSELEENKEIRKTSVFSNIPRLEVHNDSGEILQDEDEEMAFDSLNVNINNEIQRNSVNEPPKSISSEKKLLNQPKKLPNLDNDSLLSEMHSALHTKLQYDDKTVVIKENSSGRSTPSINDDLVTAALTETELSDWARDGAVSDDFDDIPHLDLNPKIKDTYNKRTEAPNSTDKKASMAEFDDMGHICGKERQSNDLKNVNMVTECVNSVLHPKIDNIEFMDTGTETSSDDNMEIKNNGYVQFHNEDDFVEDSLSPTINDIIEITNPIIKKPVYEEVIFSDLSTETKNTGYCEIGNERNKIESQVQGVKNADIERPKEKQIPCDNEDDSLVVIETGTTTEENTCSDSTVKNITEKTLDSLHETPKSIEPKKLLENNFMDRKRLEDKLVQVKLDMAKFNEQKNLRKTDSKFETKVIDQVTVGSPSVSNESNDKEPNIEFQEHCQRLQSKIEFSNVKDSIDIRKSRRKSKSEIVKPDLIQEEKEKLNVGQSGQKDVALNLAQSKLYKKEEIEKERNMNQRLVQEMVMNKMKAQNKSLERKKRTRNSFSPIRSFELSKSATMATAPQTLDSPISSKNVFSTPDVLLSTMPVPLQKSQTISSITNSTKHESIKTLTASQTEQNFKKLHLHNPDAFSLPDISKTNDEVFVTPKVPPRLKNEEAKRTAEKLKQDARARVRLMSDEDLGLSPEDKLLKLKQKASKRGKDVEHVDVHIQDSIESLVINTERRNSLLYNNDTLKRNTSFRRSKSGDGTLNTQSSFDLTGKLSVPKTKIEGPSPARTKSVSDINKPLHVQSLNKSSDRSNTQFCKSDPNLLIDGGGRKEKKKCKDRERRKSITKFLTDIFIKKKDNSPTNTPNKSFLSRISPKSKNKSKSCVALDLDDIDKNSREQPLRRNSVSEVNLRGDIGGNISPPPIPPLPANYTGSRLSKDESSDAENEFKRHDRSSCDTLDQSGIHDGSVSSFTGRRSGRSARKAIRQAQLKRHRMAQEIQRKLEETEVKTRELENRGVLVEKALRGESNGSAVDSGRDDSELLKEWFDLMRDRTELRRYERELIVRAQELELEDRHARLQHELRDRLESDEPKTTEEMEVEGSIIKEMMEIVSKRDSLITLLEEDRIRYSEEDRDFEEQMLAKGIHLTPLTKPPDQ